GLKDALGDLVHKGGTSGLEDLDAGGVAEGKDAPVGLAVLYRHFPARDAGHVGVTVGIVLRQRIGVGCGGPASLIGVAGLVRGQSQWWLVVVGVRQCRIQLVVGGL